MTLFQLVSKEKTAILVKKNKTSSYLCFQPLPSAIIKSFLKEAGIKKNLCEQEEKTQKREG